MSATDRHVMIYRRPDGLYVWEVRPRPSGRVTAQISHVWPEEES